MLKTLIAELLIFTVSITVSFVICYIVYILGNFIHVGIEKLTGSNALGDIGTFIVIVSCVLRFIGCLDRR